MRRALAPMVLCLWLGATAAWAVCVDTGWQRWIQPDGVTFLGRAWGDEVAMELLTADGYPFVQDGAGYCYYSELGEDGFYHATTARVGLAQPQAHGIQPGPQSNAARKAWILARQKELGIVPGVSPGSPRPAGKPLWGSTSTWTSPTTLHVVLVTFGEDPANDFDEPYGYRTEDFLRLFQGPLSGAVTLSNGEVLPETFGSVRDYLANASRGAFDLQVRVVNNTDGDGFPIWVELPWTKEYCRTSVTVLQYFEEAFVRATTTYGLTIPGTRYGTGSLADKVVYLYSGATFTNHDPVRALHPQTDGYGIYASRYVMGEREGFGNNNHNIDTFAGIGTHVHEFGHLLGFYHPHGEWLGTNPHPNPPQTRWFPRANVMSWGAMQNGAPGPPLESGGWTEPYRSCPNPYNAFYRWDLGWPAVVQVTETTTGLVVNPGPDNLYAIDGANGATYLLEHRQDEGFGRYVSYHPHEDPPGLLIWRRESHPATDANEHPALIPADGRSIRDAREDEEEDPDVPPYQDLLTDPFPGPDPQDQHTNATDASHLRHAVTGWTDDPHEPNPDPGDSHIALRNITNHGTHSTLDVIFNYWSGPLAEDATWSGTVRLGGDVTVPAGVTLTIQSGTVVEFAATSDEQKTGFDTSACELLVYGTVQA